MAVITESPRTQGLHPVSLLAVLTLLIGLLVPVAAPRVRAATLIGLTDQSTSKIRAAMVYARAFGYRGAFPNFETADYLDGRGPVWGTILIKLTAADFLDIPASQLDTSSPEALVYTIKDWANAHGYNGAIPTFQTANYNDGRGPVWGAILFKPGTADFQDIPAGELDTSSSEALIRTVGRYAVAHGYRGGFPTFQTATYNNGPVWGAYLVKQTAADWRDVPATNLEIPITLVNEHYDYWTVGGGYVYWASCPPPPVGIAPPNDHSEVVNATTSNYFRRMRLTTGPVQTLKDNLAWYDFPCSTYGFKADDTSLYSWDDQGLTKRPVNALNQPAQLYSGSLPDIWVLGQDAVYWASKTQIFRAAKNGAGGAALVNATVNDLAVDDQYVYWTSTTGVWKAPLTCVATSCVPQQLSAEPARNLVVVGSSNQYTLYFTANGKSIRRLTCSTSTCSASTVFNTTGSDSIVEIYFGAENLFWIESYDRGCPAPGPCFRNYRVRRLSTTGGLPVTLMDGTSDIPSLLSDTLGLYISKPKYGDDPITLFPVFNIRRTFLSIIQQ